MDKDSEILQDLKRKMDGAIKALKNSFSGLRAGRASTALLDPIKVNVYGQTMYINQVASVSVPDAKMLLVQVWDNNLVPIVEKAILNSGLGLTPNTAGEVIRLQLPDLSEERRKELVKKANDYSEQNKVSIRNIRRSALDLYKKQQKEGEISEDDLKSYSNEIQKITDSYIRKIDDMLISKSNDILIIGSATC
jgi:ribosome recycling factor